MGPLLCVKVGGGQFSVGHVEGLGLINPFLPTEGTLTVKVALPQIVQLVGSVYVVLAVKLHLCQLLLCQRAVNVKGHRSLPNIHAEVSFNGF